MKVEKEVTLSEKELNEIIIEAVEKETKMKVKSLRFRTSVAGDYDRGNARQFVEHVYIELESE